MRASVISVTLLPLIMGVWVAAAPAPFRRTQEVTATLALPKEMNADKVLACLEGARSEMARSGERLTFEATGGGRVLRVSLQAGKGVDALKLLSDLVEKCLRVIYPRRASEARWHRSYCKNYQEILVELGAGRRTENQRRALLYCLERYAAELRKQEAATVLQPPRLTRR